MEYTQREREVIALIEQRTGKKISTGEERIEVLKKWPKEKLVDYRDGLQQVLSFRLNFDNIDYYNSEEDGVKTKILQECLDIVNGLLNVACVLCHEPIEKVGTVYVYAENGIEKGGLICAKCQIEKEKNEDVIARYPHLHREVRSVLTDFYNLFIGLRLHFGNDEQREIGNEIMDEILRDGRDPFPTYHFSQSRMLKDIENELQTIDYDHLRELEEIIKHTNQLVREKRLTADVAKKINAILITYMYGR